MPQYQTAVSAKLSLLLFLSIHIALSQPAGTNYDEKRVPKYTLPEILALDSGKRVTSADQWFHQRRPEIEKLFETYVFGKSPDPPAGIRFKVKSIDKAALGGAATRKEIAVSFSEKPGSPEMSLLVYLPNQAKRPVPIFMGLNFGGNQTVNADPAIAVTTRWVPAKTGVVNHHATEASRGRGGEPLAPRHDPERRIRRGYGICRRFVSGLCHRTAAQRASFV